MYLNVGFALMGYGLLGVFTVLALFIATIVMLVKAFPAKDEE